MNGINEFFNTYGLTGNTMIDSILLAHFIPIIASYINTLTRAITNLLLIIWNLIIGYIQDFIKTRMLGNTLCVVYIDKDNQLYDFLQENIFNKRIPSDILYSRSRVLSLLALLKNLSSSCSDKTKLDNDHYNKYLKKKCENRVKLHVKYDDKHNEILEHECISPYYSSSQSERKFFNHKDKVIIIKKFENGHSSHFIIKLLDFSSNNTATRNENINIIEDFLKSRFDLKERIYYVYSLKSVNPRMYEVIKSMIFNGSINSTIALLKYGGNYDVTNYDTNSIAVSQNLNFDCSCQTFNSLNQDYKKFITINDINENQKVQENSFNYYYQNMLVKIM